MKLLQDIQNNQVQKVKISRVQEVQEVQEAQEAQEAQEVQKVQKGGPKGRTRFVDREANRDDNKLTLKEAGGGPNWPYGFSIGCHFSQDHAMVTKILDFIHIHPK